MIDHPSTEATVRDQANTLFVSLELSKARWMLTVSAPGSSKTARHSINGGDAAAMLQVIARLQAAAAKRCATTVPVVVIQEAGLDGFWIHRLLIARGIESHVVDPASIAVNRRHRRPKTDAIDGELLRRTLRAWFRGERQVCSMVQPPSPEAEDRRRLSRERGRLIKERVQHTNRIKGLLAGQGVTDYEPLHQNRRGRLAALVTGDGRPLPERLRAEIEREIVRLDLVLTQLAAVEMARDALLAETTAADEDAAPSTLLRLRGTGVRLAALARGALPPLRQPPAARGLCRADTESVAERRRGA
jgi:transposase